MYKLTRPNGMDFYSSTINYRDAIGTIIRIKDYDPPEKGVCGRGLHASRNPNDCFIGAEIPCAAFKVQGINRIAGDKKKVRYKGLKIIEEIEDLDKLFGWNYSEAINPIHPFKIKAPEVNQKVLQLLKEWNPICNSVGNSVVNSIWGFGWKRVWDSIRNSVGNSIWSSIRHSIGHSVRSSVRSLVWNSSYAYIGSLFPNIKKWDYVYHKEGVYPFQSGADLWRMGFVSSYEKKVWRLHAGPYAKVVWEGKI